MPIRCSNGSEIRKLATSSSAASTDHGYCCRLQFYASTVDCEICVTRFSWTTTHFSTPTILSTAASVMATVVVNRTIRNTAREVEGDIRLDRGTIKDSIREDSIREDSIREDTIREDTTRDSRRIPVLGARGESDRCRVDWISRAWWSILTCWTILRTTYRRATRAPTAGERSTRWSSLGIG